MKIRKATEKDRNKLINLMQKASAREKEWSMKRAESYTNRSDKLILIAEEKSKLIGYVGIKKYEDNKARKFVNLNSFMWVTWIAVLPEFRNKNVGSKLLKASEKYVSQFNRKGIVLDCRKNLVGFYEKNSYSIKGRYLDKLKWRYVLVKEIK